jgi:hypothetical protein
MTTPHVRSKFSRLSGPVIMGTIASLLAILGGIVPDFTAAQPSYLFANAARADEFSDSDLRSYAIVLDRIEPIRTSALAQISKANNSSTLPNLVCNQPNTMEGLNSEAKSLFINYCNQCESIAASQGLSVDRFNQITKAVLADPKLQERVQQNRNK